MDINIEHVLSPKCNKVHLEDGAYLEILDVKRYLPNRRIACHARLGDQVVFAKIFLGKSALRYANRDKDGALLLLNSSIKTPSFLHQLKLSTPKGVALIYALLEPAMNAEEKWHDGDAIARAELMFMLTKCVANHHIAGLVQTDMYFKNFLLFNQDVYTLDGDGIRKTSHFSRKTIQLHNLATLFSKMTVLETNLIEGLYQQYCQCLRYLPNAKELSFLLKHSQKIRMKHAYQYAYKKVFRSCTDILKHVTKHIHMLVDRKLSVQGLDCITFDHLLTASIECLKNGQTCTVYQAVIQQQPVVIKRYNIKNQWHALSRAWRPSRAANAWRNAHLLQYFGIATPAPLCLLETRYFGLRGKAYFVASHSPWPDAASFFKQTIDESLRQQAILQLVTVCYQFYLLQLSHGDMKASNLQITETGQVVVLDLDSLRLHRCRYWAMRRHVKDIQRLLQNWKADASLYNALVEQFNVIYTDVRPLKLAGIANS